jgi:hypothetical protein
VNGEAVSLFSQLLLRRVVGDQLEQQELQQERMLLINQNLPRVRLELGVFYYRLGSYEVARNYLESALRLPTVPTEVRRRAEEYLAKVGSKLSPSSLAGDVFFGWRYQSNANLGPAMSRVLLFG